MKSLQFRPVRRVVTCRCRVSDVYMKRQRSRCGAGGFMERRGVDVSCLSARAQPSMLRRTTLDLSVRKPAPAQIWPVSEGLPDGKCVRLTSTTLVQTLQTTSRCIAAYMVRPVPGAAGSFRSGSFSACISGGPPGTPGRAAERWSCTRREIGSPRRAIAFRCSCWRPWPDNIR